jgi:outer membrane receptor protein involved in Fe transport
MLEVRKRATTVADALSAQEMSRGGDSSAAGAVKRVVSVTINEGKYVVLRGLGGRYVSTLLNGVTLPSPEPDRQAVPLDLFPTSLLSNLMISKSYDPANPGTFGGGTLSIETNSYPDDLRVSVKASTAADTATTMQSNPAGARGSLDVLGFDSGSRGLPSAVPRDRAARLSSEGMDAAQLEAIGESFANNWTVGEDVAYPNFGVGATVGDTVNVKGKKLGYLTSLTYGHKLQTRAAEVSKVRNADGMLEYREQLSNIRGTESAKLGGLVSTGYRVDADNEINFFSLYTHNGQASAQRVTGTSEADGQEIDSTRTRFVERYLSFNQLQGVHRFSDKGDLELVWQGNLALAASDEPDTRDMTYNVLDDGRIRFKNETGSGERFFSELSQRSLGAGIALTKPVGDKLKLKSGAVVQRTDRDFSARRFRFAFVGNDPSVLFLGPDSILSADNIGSSFRVEERTMGTDAYDASLSVLGASGSAEVEATDKLRVAGGVRFEQASQALTPGSRFAAQQMDLDSVSRNDGDFLPGTSATYALSDDVNLRGAYSYTLARPQFREMAPFLFFDYARRRSVSGNPELERTRIHNADVRWEWFPGDADVLAASLFYKRFRNPIEQVIVSASGGDVSFANAAAADTMGAELEAKFGLGHLAEALDRYKAWANLALIQSEIELRMEDVGSQTNASRPLQGQAPYVLNLGFGYTDEKTDIYALYNVSGKSIAEVGFDSLPDVHQMPFHRFDLTGSQRLTEETRLKVSAVNLLNRSVRMKQGDLDIFRYQPGVGFSLSVEWTPR